ncbi:ABC transporter substrate-binding protein [Kribbella shirazensis]|uniref:Peptide/nickel transport system substrate-binding protein n=1 Tax=Kribbella shirazensis TaxID=1105143 RepID=A0A7X5VAG7_9ACTN|nr:ABC transporter substrate-binding protein [Kribbella shirazensis]NIK57656.1 peptide/nickel transport system substrate-binding protein [Kribbella shirazensis]
MKRTVLAIAAAAALAVSGCAANANSNGGGKEDAGDTLVAAYSEGGKTLDPAEANDVTSDTFVVAAYDQLVTYGRTEVDGKPKAKTDEIVPMLAESWQASADITSYTFKLRAGAKFQNGSPVTADAVVKSFAHIKASSSASFLYKMAGIAKVTKVDEHTVKIDLTAPNHLFLQILPMYSFSIIDMDTVAKNGGAKWLATNTAGSGPYSITKWDPATEASMTRNDGYWGDKPKLRQVSVKFIAEASNRVQLLRKGEVGLALEVPPKDVQSLKSADGVVIDSRASNKILFFAMNNNIKPFDDPRVRQAVSYAIPYEKLLNDVMKGEASPMKSAVASSTPGFSDAGYTYKHDLDKARALLAEAGLSKGFSFDFTLGSGFDDWNDDAVLIQAELAKIGVTMNIKKMARPQFLEALETKKVQSYITRWTSFVNDPGYHLGLLLTSQGSSNYANFSDPVVDKAWQQAATEPDVAKRNKLYGEAQQSINTKSPWAYLYEYNIVVAHRAGIDGYTSYPDGIVRFVQLSGTTK